MNLFAIRDAFFWKDRISVDALLWARQRERIDRLELIAGLQTAMLGALLTGIVLSSVRLGATVQDIRESLSVDRKSTAISSAASAHPGGEAGDRLVRGLEHGEVSLSQFNF